MSSLPESEDRLMPRLMIPSAFVLASVALAAPLEAQQYCRNIPASSGYPVSATWIESGGGSREYLQQILDAAVYRWRVPSRDPRRDSYLNSARSWARPPEPRWAEVWPEAQHTASLSITLFRNGNVRGGDLLSESGDELFDNSLKTIIEKPMPGAPEFAAFLDLAVGDSAVVLLHFGEALPGAPVIRFAAEQTGSMATQSTLYRMHSGVIDDLRYEDSDYRPRYQSSFKASTWAVIKYDVNPSGTVARGSTEILKARGYEFAQAAEMLLRRATFTPATSNCRPVAESKIWNFGRPGG